MGIWNRHATSGHWRMAIFTSIVYCLKRASWLGLACSGPWRNTILLSKQYWNTWQPEGKVLTKNIPKVEHTFPWQQAWIFFACYPHVKCKRSKLARTKRRPRTVGFVGHERRQSKRFLVFRLFAQQKPLFFFILPPDAQHPVASGRSEKVYRPGKRYIKIYFAWHHYSFSRWRMERIRNIKKAARDVSRAGGKVPSPSVTFVKDIVLPRVWSIKDARITGGAAKWKSGEPRRSTFHLTSGE